MKEMFDAVQGKFKQLDQLLSGLDIKKDLAKPEVLADVNDTLAETYVLINQGFCENAHMCEKCVDNRDQLRMLVEMMDQCEENREISKEVYLSLEKFKQNIPNILQKMQSVYLETLQNTQA